MPDNTTTKHFSYKAWNLQHVPGTKAFSFVLTHPVVKGFYQVSPGKSHLLHFADLFLLVKGGLLK